MRKAYQPIASNLIDEETLPYDLFSFQAFESREDCEEWLKRHGYEPTIGQSGSSMRTTSKM